MKVYVLIFGWPCEGHGDPDGVFTTEEAAKAAARKILEKYSFHGDFYNVFEFELDKCSILDVDE